MFDVCFDDDEHFNADFEITIGDDGHLSGIVTYLVAKIRLLMFHHS